MKILNTSLNIFDLPQSSNCAVCVLTNGIIKKDGSLVMGAGQAKEADVRFKCAKEFGKLTADNGIKPCCLNRTVTGFNTQPYLLFSFPTKYHWRDKSDLNLITTSAYEIVRMVNNLEIDTCYLPPPGCGLGGLNWKTQVKPILESILDDRFIVVLRE